MLQKKTDILTSQIIRNGQHPRRTATICHLQSPRIKNENRSSISQEKAKHANMKTT